MYFLYIKNYLLGFSGGSDGKESARNVGDLGSVLELERSPGEGMATHPSILAWRIPWAEEPGGLQSVVSQRVGHDTDKLFFMNLEIRGHSKKAMLFK